MKKQQNRLKSKLLWAAVIAQVIALGQLTGVWAKLGIDAGTAGDVAAGILQLFVIAGIVNDPTNSTGI
jgi:uncharacterized membrane protein